MQSFPRITVFNAALLASVITLIVYLPTLTFDALNLDDSMFIDNPAIRKLDLGFVKWAFTSSEGGWWMPIIWLSFAVDYAIWHGAPVGYHLSNILCHAVNTFLVAIVADELYKRILKGEIAARADHSYPLTIFLAALFFGIHPVHVESVAWISERKNVLSTIFSLSSIYCYLKYVVSREAGAAGNSSRKAYLLSVFFLGVSLMAKPLGVMIPTLLLIVDWYPFNRIRRGRLYAVIGEKLPFFTLATAVAAATILLASGERILVPLSLFPLTDRFIISGYALFEYCRLMLFPSNMVVLWLVPTVLPLSYVVKATVIFAVTLLTLALIKIRPWVPAVWFCFLLMHLPSLHFFLNGACSVSAHFLYIPSIFMILATGGLFFTACAKLTAAQNRYGLMALRFLVGGVLIAAVAATSYELTAWKNSGTFWTRMIEIEPVGRFYYYRGDHYFRSGNYSAAVDDFEESIRIAYGSGHPEIYTLHAFRGDALRKAGRHAEAVREFTTAINLVPVPNFYYYRALSLRALGKVVEAEDDLARSGGNDGPIIWQYVQNRDDLKPRQQR